MWMGGFAYVVYPSCQFGTEWFSYEIKRRESPQIGSCWFMYRVTLHDEPQITNNMGGSWWMIGFYKW